MYASGTITGIATAGVVEFAQVEYEEYGEFRARNRSVNLTFYNDLL